ncbi:hypothetical protein [Desulfitobacterium hafniense]|uniref:hypothetical protein n=1 Tax=Desulfitobacterium hafniense TaxID=49338 RepID=UPI001FA78DD3|nr:hypothetical protein [Desulfitobacterium hafniense]
MISQGLLATPAATAAELIQPGEHEIATIIYSFDGTEELDYWLERLASYLKDYCGVVEAKTLIVKKCWWQRIGNSQSVRVQPPEGISAWRRRQKRLEQSTHSLFCLLF